MRFFGERQVRAFSFIDPRANFYTREIIAPTPDSALYLDFHGHLESDRTVDTHRVSLMDSSQVLLLLRLFQKSLNPYPCFQPSLLSLSSLIL